MDMNVHTFKSNNTFTYTLQNFVVKISIFHPNSYVQKANTLIKGLNQRVSYVPINGLMQGTRYTLIKGLNQGVSYSLIFGN